MKNLLFIILPYPSHFYASFPLAKKLRSEGNLITYTGTPQFEKIITNEGFRFISFKYVSEYKIKTFNVFLGLLLKSILVKSFLETRRTEFLMNILNVRKLVIESNPNEIFLDEHLSEYYIYYLNLNVKTKILCTKTSTRKTFGIPPMDSDYMPTNSIYSNWKCEILWIFKNIKDQLKKVTYKLAFLDKDENHIGTIIWDATSDGNDTIFFYRQNAGYSNRGNIEINNPILIKIGVHTTHVVRYQQMTSK